MKSILCLDFDGVCHSYTSGWIGPTMIPDPPVERLREFLIEAGKEFSIHIFSGRSHYPNGRKAMRKWFDMHGMADISINFPLSKPPAKITIDNRCIRFDGVWPDLDELKAFKPWNRL